MSSIGQTLYQFTARRGPPAKPRGPRPNGRLVWIHLSEGATEQSVAALSDRLREDHGIHVLVTGGKTSHFSDDVPWDHSKDVAEFLLYWAPNVIVMTGTEIRPALIEAARLRQIPTLLVDAGVPRLLRGMDAWMPGLLQTAVRNFKTILTVDESSARAYRNLGAQNVHRFGRLAEGSLALPYREAERAELASLFATRPVWLAIQVPESEEAAVIAAHRSAMRLAHRLLLILIPDNPNRAAILAENLELTEGWLVARRELDEEPDPEISVYIAETVDEYGLWYRLAPVTFMGGSLAGGGSKRSPMEPAALGSSIIHGRKTGAFGIEYGRLGAALGTAPASTSNELSDLLSELLAPDRAARLAHAAWAVASEGAEVTDRVVTLILQSMPEIT